MAGWKLYENLLPGFEPLLLGGLLRLILFKYTGDFYYYFGRLLKLYAGLYIFLS